jgi:hypothetical protein
VTFFLSYLNLLSDKLKQFVKSVIMLDNEAYEKEKNVTILNTILS